MRNVFVSYAHRLDQIQVDDFRQKYGNDKMVFSDRSLENMDIGHLSDDTIKNNYIKPKIRNVSSIPEYLKIEEIITSITGINAYIKRITGRYGIPLNECYGWEQRAGDSIEKSSSSHPLAGYLKTY